MGRASSDRQCGLSSSFFYLSHCFLPNSSSSHTVPVSWKRLKHTSEHKLLVVSSSPELAVEFVMQKKTRALVHKL